MIKMNSWLSKSDPELENNESIETPFAITNRSNSSSNTKPSIKEIKKFKPNPENVVMLSKPNVTPVDHSIVPDTLGFDYNLQFLKTRLNKPIQTDNKYLAFQQNDIDPETTKCMEFWKAVMERNLEPIQNTLKSKFESLSVPEPLAAETEQEICKISIKEEKEVQEESKQSLEAVESQKKSRKSLEILGSTSQEVDWKKTIRKMQLKNLNRIQMLMKERNQHKKLHEEPVVVAKTKSVQSHRKSKSRLQSRLSIKSRTKEIVSHTEIEEKVVPEEQNLSSKPILLELNEPELEPPKIVKLSKIEPLVPISNIVDFKKKNREYSRWRDPEVKCNCRDLNCTCNKNPNISCLSIPPSRKRLDSASGSAVNYHHYEKATASNFNSIFGKPVDNTAISMAHDNEAAKEKLLENRTDKWNTEAVQLHEPDEELQEIAREYCQIKKRNLHVSPEESTKVSDKNIVLLPPKYCTCEATDCACPKKEPVSICCVCNSPICRCGLRSIFDERYITYYRDFKNRIDIQIKAKKDEMSDEKVLEKIASAEGVSPVEMVDKEVQFPEIEDEGYKVKKEDYCIICGKHGKGCDYIFDIYG